MYLRIAVLFSAVALIALVIAVVGLATSGDGGGGDGDGSTAEDGAIASCSALEELESYRYTVSVHIANGATEPTVTGAEQSPAPLSALSEALAQLLSDFTLTGAYVNPDRSQALLQFSGDEVELRQIGDESWVRVGDKWSEEDVATNDLLTPVLVCNEVVQAMSSSLTAGDPQDGEVNGVESLRYVLDPDRSKNLPPVLGQDLEGPFESELWVADDGRFPVRLLIESEAADGEDAAFRLAMDVTDVNAEGITVERPERE